MGRATTGEESLTLIDEPKPGLVLMDVHLPGTDGAEATRRMRGQQPHSRAIGVQGHTGVDFIVDAPAIRKALATKQDEYGDVDAQFVIPGSEG